MSHETTVPESGNFLASRRARILTHHLHWEWYCIGEERPDGWPFDHSFCAVQYYITSCIQSLSE